MKNFKKMHLSHVFVFAIVALMMTLNVNAATKEITVEKNEFPNILNPSKPNIMPSTDPIVVEAGEDVVINLKGNLTTVNDHAITVNKGATVTIKGDGVVTANGASHAAIINNGGTVIVEGGTYSSTNWYAVKNLGVMTIKGGIFNGTEQKENSSLIANGYYKEDEYPEKVTDEILLTIDGGEFIHKNTTSTIKSDDWSKIVINDGKFESTKGFVIQATGTVEVNGGTFTGTSPIAVLDGTANNEAKPGVLKITGGTFTGKYVAISDQGGKLTITNGDFTNVTDGVISPAARCDGKICDYTASITGGTYAKDVSEYVATGYVQEVENETYKVVKQEVKVEIPTVDTTKKVEEVTVGVKEDKTVSESLQKALEEAVKADSELAAKVKDINTVVNVAVSNQKEEEAPKAAVEAITKLAETKSSMKVASFFDITLNIEDKTGKTLGTLTELDKEITFNVALPEDLTKVEEGYTRTYYIVRYHGDEAEILDTELNGNVLTFATDKFSTYAIAYTDTKTETKTETNPKTGDNVVLYFTTGIIALAGIGYTALNIKKRKNN